MPENLNTGRGPEILGIAVDPAMQVAEIANSIGAEFGFRSVPSGWRVARGFRTLYRADNMINRAAPYVEVLGSFEDPGEQLGADLAEIRDAVEASIVADNNHLDPEEARRSATPAQVSRAVGRLVSDQLFADPSSPSSLKTPLLRGLADVRARQVFGRNDATATDLMRYSTLPSHMIRKAAAPELLQALGFDPEHPMVLSADRGGFVRGLGRLVAGSKLDAITRVPELARHVQAMLPKSGAELRQNFGRVQAFLGFVTGKAQVQQG
jgi:hypothetical protein